MTNNATPTTIRRGQYGQILTTSQQVHHPDPAGGPGKYEFVPPPRLVGLAQAILSEAIRRGQLAAPYCEVDHRHRGEALNYDLYDVAPGVALVQSRLTICTKYGSSPKKSYLLLRRKADKISVASADAHKAVIAKLAKQEPRLGAIIAHCEGKKALRLPGTPAPPPEIGYKLLRQDNDGSLSSVWDGSPWEIGKPRREAAKKKHQGGLYYYRTIQEAVLAARHKKVFAADMQHHRLAVVQVEASGKRVSYGKRWLGEDFGWITSDSHWTEKLAATQITPFQVVAMTL